MATSLSSIPRRDGLAKLHRRGATLGSMKRGKALHPAVNEWIRQHLQAWLDEDPSRKRKHLAAILDVTPPHMTNILKNGHGIGADVEELAAKLFGIGVEDLRRRAHAEWKGNDTAPQPEDRYRNRAIAVAFMRPWVDPEAIRQILSLSLDAASDPPPKWWADQIEAANQLVRMDLRDPARISAREKQASDEGDAMEHATKPKKRPAKH